MQIILFIALGIWIIVSLLRGKAKKWEITLYSVLSILGAIIFTIMAIVNYEGLWLVFTVLCIAIAIASFVAKSKKSENYHSSNNSAHSLSNGNTTTGRVSKEESARIIMALVISGESCDTCRHYADTYGDCPWEPDARNERPNVNGIRICHKHSNGPLSR